jgi:hypothetical protein
MNGTLNDLRRNLVLTLLAALVMTGLAASTPLRAERSLFGAAQAATPAAKSVGTVKAISGNTITLASEGGGEINVTVGDGARVVRVEPGSTDLKNAAPMQLQDLQAGDRILVRGTPGDGGKSMVAVSVIAMKKADLAEKHAHEREEWQKHGVGGLVTAVDAAAGTVQLDTSALGANKNVTVAVSKSTVLRRYAPGSINFDDASAAPIDQIKVGDQLRARGSRIADGSTLTADEVVSGSFRNIAGTVTAIDAAAGTLTVNDLTTKKSVVVKVNTTSQLKKLPPAIAQGIAARLKGNSSDARASASAGGPQSEAGRPGASSAASGAPGAQGGAGGSGAGMRGDAASAGGGERERQGGAAGGPGAGAEARGGGDFQQAIARMPAATLADLQKGDAVMIVATSDSGSAGTTAITLLAGVEPILQASPSGGQSILTPWSLNGSPGGDAATQ